jgi:hypothetical protein
MFMKNVFCVEKSVWTVKEGVVLMADQTVRFGSSLHPHQHFLLLL